jgi:divalent metal cation (Fe/Co/Zn/Cd) transporter
MREQRADVLICWTLIVLGFNVILTATLSISKGPEAEAETAEHIDIMLIIYGASIAIFAVLAIMKFQYAKILNSPSLFKDGVCSLIGSVLALAMFVTAWINKAMPEIWLLDPIASLVAGIGAIGYGILELLFYRFKEGQHIFSWSWWTENAPKDNTALLDPPGHESKKSQSEDTVDSTML